MEVTAFNTKCSAYVSCSNRCACGDSDCAQKCTMSADCESADEAIERCARAKCALPPACGGSTKTCAELSACCAKIADNDDKTACNAEAAKGNAVLCSNAFSDYQSQCP
jgi:hypothetical protein